MVIWYLAAFLAFFVKGLCGFANTLVFTSILNFANSNAAITPVELLLGYPTNAIIAWKNAAAFAGGCACPFVSWYSQAAFPAHCFSKAQTPR